MVGRWCGTTGVSRAGGSDRRKGWLYHFPGEGNINITVNFFLLARWYKQFDSNYTGGGGGGGGELLSLYFTLGSVSGERPDTDGFWWRWRGRQVVVLVVGGGRRHRSRKAIDASLFNVLSNG